MSKSDWVSVSEAAKRLTASGDAVDRSSLSRYLKKHAEALPRKQQGRSSSVEYNLLVSHRKENIRIAQPAEQTQSDSVSGNGNTKFAGTQVNGSARKSLADAGLREMDLAERQGKLTPVSEVDRAGRSAVALMLSAFDRAIEGEAATLSLKYGWDERSVRLALKVFAKSGTDMFHREILSRIDTLNRNKNSDAVADGIDSPESDYALQ